MSRTSSSATAEPNGKTNDSAYNLTVEQLAAEVGMSVRNIRNHHSRGLLPAPEVRARVGYYGPDHVARLKLVLDMQADGFNLAAIERLLSASGGSAGRLLGLRNAMTAPFESETPEVITGEELLQRFGEVDAKDVERIRKLGLLIPLGDDRFEVPSPALMQAAEEVTALGIPLHAARHRLRGAAGNVQAAHDRTGRGRLGQAAGAPGQALALRAISRRPTTS